MARSLTETTSMIRRHARALDHPCVGGGDWRALETAALDLEALDECGRAPDVLPLLLAGLLLAPQWWI
jgi:hypothetical protein